MWENTGLLLIRFWTTVQSDDVEQEYPAVDQSDVVYFVPTNQKQRESLRTNHKEAPTVLSADANRCKH